MLPTPFALFVAIAAWRTNSDNILRTFMLCCLFGATAAFTLPPLGNAPVTPAVAMVPVLVWRALAGRDINDAMPHLAPGRAGFWLLLLLVWGLATALVLPRLFEGETYVFSTSRGSDFAGVGYSLLAPNSTNITQPAYLVLGVVVFLAVSLLLEAKGRAEKFAMAVVALGVLNVVAAVLGLLEFELGIAGPVQILKNGGYAILSTHEVAGLARITGTFPEASAFAGFTVPLLAFIGSLWRSGFKPRLTGPLALVLLALLLLSTSTTAYVAVAAYAACLAVAGSWQAMRPGGRRVAMGWGTGLVGAAVATACLFVLLAPDVFTTVWSFLETVVITKIDSQSGVERGSWNAQAWVNTMDTYGLGAGLGSVRASSYPFVLLSNVGFLGTAFFAAFMWCCWFGSRAEGVKPGCASTAVVRLAARHGLLAGLIAASLVATVFDLGLFFYALAAAAAMRQPSVSGDAAIGGASKPSTQVPTGPAHAD